MRVDVALPTHAAVPAARPAPAPSAEFARLLGGLDAASDGEIVLAGADPAEAAAAATLLMQPAGTQRDASRSLRAFGFDVFGLFPPGRAPGAPEAATADGPPPGPEAALDSADPQAVALAAGGPDDLLGAGDVAGAAGLAERIAGAGERPSADPHGAPGATDAPELGETPPPPRQGAAEADPLAELAPVARAVRPPCLQRPVRASLLLTEQDGHLAVVAAAAGLDPADHAAVRTRLKAAAADLGVTLEDIHLNGQSAASPAAEGDRHGPRAR